MPGEIDAALIAPSKAHLMRMQDECDMSTNLPKEAERQRQFLAALRESYSDLQAKENLLLTMEGMQELEPINPDELQFLDSEAVGLRAQVKQLRVDIKDAKEALQSACTSLADNWDRFEALLVEHEQLSQQEAADKAADVQKDTAFFLAALERQRAHGSFGALSAAEAHTLLPQDDLAACATLRERQAVAAAAATAQLSASREQLQRAQSELNAIQLAASASRTECARLRAAIAAAPPIVISTVDVTPATNVAGEDDAETQRLRAFHSVVAALGGVRIVGSVDGAEFVLSLDDGVALRLTRAADAADALAASADPLTAALHGVTGVSVECSLGAHVFTDIVAHFMARPTQRLAFLVREVRARVASHAQRAAELVALAAVAGVQSVHEHANDARLVSVTLAAYPAGTQQPRALVKATLLVSPDYPRAGAYVHLIAQLAGAAPLTVERLLSTQERMNAEQSQVSLTDFVLRIQSELSAAPEAAPVAAEAPVAVAGEAMDSA